MNHPARRLSAALLAAALTFGLAACGNDQTATPDAAPTQDTSSATSTPEATETEKVSADTGDVAPSDAPTAKVDEEGNLKVCTKSDEPFTGEAARVFGADNVKAAYCQFVEMQIRYAYTSMMEKDLDELDEGSFYHFHRYLTPSAQEKFDLQVKEALTGNEDAHTSLTAFTQFAVEDPGTGYVLNEFPYVLERQWSPASTLVDRTEGNPRLAIRFVMTADIRMLKNDKPVIIPVIRDLTFWAVPSGNTEVPWRIDDWEITYSGGKERRDKTHFVN